MTTYQLIYCGEILPGHDARHVRERMAETLKLAPAQVEGLFSGRRIVLRKSLPQSEVARYLRHFEDLGARVHAELLSDPGVAVATVASASVAPAAATPTQPQPPPPSAPPALALVEAVEEMVCPKCGERQPKRTLCRCCAVDMKRFAEAKAESDQEAREARLAAARGELPADTAAAARQILEGESSSVIGVDLSGRIGRLDYLFGGFAGFAIFLLGLAVFVRSMNFVVFLLAAAFCFFFSFRLAALRCHDRGWSGWWSLVMLVPYLGWLFGLLLMVLPGERSANRFGVPKPALPVPGMIALVAVFGLSIAMVARSPLDPAQLQAMMGGAQVAKAGEHSGRQASGAIAASEQVEIFTTTTCGECARAKSYMTQHRIPFVERDVEFDSGNRQEFYERGGRGVPYIFVRGQSMHGFDEGAFERLRAS